MKISNLLETATPSSMPDNNTSAPKFGRSDDVLESGVGTSVAGGMAPSAKPMGKMRTRGQGSMFQGISTSSKYANSAKAGISEDSVNEDELSEEQLQAKKRREEIFKRAKDRELGNKPQSREIMAKEEFNGEYDDEAGMFKNNLQTIQRVSLHLEKAIADNENLPEWCQEKIGVAKSMVVTVMDYMISQHENGEQYTVDEGYYSNYDNNRTGFSKPKRDLSGEGEPAGMFTVVINGRAWKEFTSNKAFSVAKTIATKHPDKTVQVKWPTGQLNTVTEGVTEGFNDDNFTIDDIHQLEQIKDFETLKARAKYLIKGKPARRMKPEKIAYFYDRVDTLTSPMKVIKLMYDLLLAGEGMKTIGSRNSTDPNVYQKRFTEEEQGLWANIHAKRERIKNGSGEHMRKPGSKGAPTASALRKSAK
jgi:hypothetical protein